MKLLLDEMLPPVVAERLRARDRDVEAVSEHRELRGLPDRDVFEHAQAAGRTLVTYNRDDFLQLDRDLRSHGRDHAGIVILHPQRFSQGAGSIGAIVTALDALLAAGPPYASFIDWLQ